MTVVTLGPKIFLRTRVQGFKNRNRSGCVDRLTEIRFEVPSCELVIFASKSCRRDQLGTCD